TEIDSTDRPTYSVGDMGCFCCAWSCSLLAKLNLSDMEAVCSLDRHNVEIHEIRRSWLRKPVLRKIYKGFHRQIFRACRHDLSGSTVEIGSGLGQIKAVI